MRRLACLLIALGSSALASTPALAQSPAPAASGEHSDNLTYVKNLPYAPANGGTPNFGTDIEFLKAGGREYALAGSYKNGLQIVDITDPENATIAAIYDCGVTQGDMQLIRQADEPRRVFATYTSDTFGDGTSTCYREAAALGFEVRKANGSGRNGTFIVELTDPLHPRTVSFVDVPQGSHNMSVHPSGNYLYNSNSDLMTSFQPAIEIFDISDLRNPVKAGELDLPTRPGLGTESHDISFSADGSRAYSAALSQGVIIDTTNPAKPSIITSFLDPTINVWHQMEPFRTTAADGTKRTFLIAEDEFAGAVGTGQCPNGGVHVYDITGAKERNPVKVGMWNIDDVGPTSSPTLGCTAHVFQLHERAKVMTLAYYNGGVRVVDLSGLEGVGLGGTALVGQPMKEVGFYRMPDANSWSAKTPRINRRTGDFYLFGNDIARGLDVYRFEGAGRTSRNPGRWRSPAEAEQDRAARPRVALTPETAGFCLLPQT
jgi:hypothetical protein